MAENYVELDLLSEKPKKKSEEKEEKKTTDKSKKDKSKPNPKKAVVDPKFRRILN